MRPISTCSAPLLPDRLYLVKDGTRHLALLCLSILLLAPAACAGTYVWYDGATGDQSPVYSGGQATDGGGTPRDYDWGFYGYGGYASGDDYYTDGRDFGGADCSGDVKVEFTWKPAYPGEPPPKQVIVVKSVGATYGDALESEDPWVAHGQADDGYGDDCGGDYFPPYGPFVCHSSSGTHYSVMDGGQTVTVPCSPSASASPDIFADSWFCWVGCSVNIIPVTVDVTGPYDPAHGDFRLLTGQQCTATLNCGCGDLDNFQWDVKGDGVFGNYDPSQSAAQVQPLDTGEPAVYFYDKKDGDSVTVTVNATVTFPDGTASDVTGKSQQISSIKPVVTAWGVNSSPNIP